MEEEYIAKLGRYMVEEIRQCSNAGVVTETEDGWDIVMPVEEFVFHDHPVGELLDNVGSVDRVASREDYELMEEIGDQMKPGETHLLTKVSNITLDGPDDQYLSVQFNVDYEITKDDDGVVLGREERVSFHPSICGRADVHTDRSWARIGR